MNVFCAFVHVHGAAFLRGDVDGFGIVLAGLDALLRQGHQL